MARKRHFGGILNILVNVQVAVKAEIYNKCGKSIENVDYVCTDTDTYGIERKGVQSGKDAT